MKTPIVIDNGSFQCRVGFANDKTPRIVFKNVLAKLRKEKGKKDFEVQVGNEIDNLDNVRFALKSQFDKNVVIHVDVQETIFDYLFSSLKISSHGKVDHPVAISEAYLNPNYCRHLMAELLFECYRIPALAYGVDSIFSLNHNFPDTNDALIVSFGHHAIEVMPFINQAVEPTHSKRINLGGSDISNFLHKLLQLKYPAHINTITLGKVQDILHTSCYIAEDYMGELEKWTDVGFYNKNVYRLCLPNKEKTQPSASQVESARERRKELARKMAETNARKREEKLAEEEERLTLLNEIKDVSKDGAEPDEIKRALKAAGVSTMNELMKTIATLKSRIAKAKSKARIAEASLASCSTETEQKPKSVLKSHDKPKDQDVDTWLGSLKDKRSEILKKRSQRRQKRLNMANRRSAAAQERMRILSQLAKKEKHDTFGMNDDDWEVYKSIQKNGGSESEEEQEELNELEQTLKANDPHYSNTSHSGVISNEEHELHIGLEKTRAPELIFQPSMIGESQAGLAETIEHILKLYPDDTQTRMVSNVFLTGGLASYNGLLSRMNKEMLEMRPFESTFKINIAKDPILDGWRGMREWAADGYNQKYLFLTKSEYEEKGGEYLKEHSASNRYYPSPYNSVSVLLND